MPDISMCANKTCPKRESCYRFLAVPTEYWQAYADFKPDENGNCEYYWPVKDAPDNRNESSKPS